MILVMIMMVIWMVLIVLINRQSTMIDWRLLHWKLYAQTTDAEQDLFSNVKLSAHSTFVKYCPAQNIRPTLIIALKSIPCLQMVLKTISASIRSASKLSPAPYINLIPLYHFWTWKNNIFFWQFLEQSHHQSHLVVIYDLFNVLSRLHSQLNENCMSKPREMKVIWPMEGRLYRQNPRDWSAESKSRKFWAKKLVNI